MPIRNTGLIDLTFALAKWNIAWQRKTVLLVIPGVTRTVRVVIVKVVGQNALFFQVV